MDNQTVLWTTDRSDPRGSVHSQLQANGTQPKHFIEILEFVVINEKWKDLIDVNGQSIPSFTDFLEMPFPYGCGTTVENVIRIISVRMREEHKSSELQAKWDAKRAKILRALQVDSGIDQYIKNYQPIIIQSVSVNRTIRNIEQDIDLAENVGDTQRAIKLKSLRNQIINRQVSAAKARILANYEEPAPLVRSAVNMNDPLSAANTIKQFMSRENVEELAQLLWDLAQDKSVEFAKRRSK